MTITLIGAFANISVQAIDKVAATESSLLRFASWYFRSSQLMPIRKESKLRWLGQPFIRAITVNCGCALLDSRFGYIRLDPTVPLIREWNAARTTTSSLA